MTSLGGIGHTLPFLIPRSASAMTAAVIVVLVELGGHHVDPEPLHGHAAFFGRRAGGMSVARWCSLPAC